MGVLECVELLSPDNEYIACAECTLHNSFKLMMDLPGHNSIEGKECLY